MHYEINVALNGRHLFATAQRSCYNARAAQEVYSAIAVRFLEKDGYSITITREHSSGVELTVRQLFGEG